MDSKRSSLRRSTVVAEDMLSVNTEHLESLVHKLVERVESTEARCTELETKLARMGQSTVSTDHVDTTGIVAQLEAVREDVVTEREERWKRDQARQASALLLCQDP